MTIDTARARFERRQRDLFRDYARIERPATTSTLDPDTGILTPNAPTLLYDGDCLLRAFTWEGTDVEAGGTEVRLQRLRAKFPKGTVVEHNDLIVPVASTYDESLVGRTFRVTDTFQDGWQICRTAICEEVT